MPDLPTRSLPVPPAGDPMILRGTVVGSWRIDEVIACGGFGAVYRVTEIATGRLAALKLLHPHLVAPQLVARLMREADVIGALRHPNVVTLLDRGVAPDGRPYLVMELLEGIDLAASIEQRGPRSPPEALAILEPLCGAVAAVHDRGVVHRDLKASNVFLAGDRVVLLDFGIAKVQGAEVLTTRRQRVGTPACMAPEQIRGQAVDARTDVYGLGALTFHMLTGLVAFEDPSPTLSQYCHLPARRPRASTIVPIARRIDDVLARAMAVEPDDRFAGALAFLAAVRAALAVDSAPETIVEGIAVRVSVDASRAIAPLDVDAALGCADRTLSSRGLRLGIERPATAIYVSTQLDAAAVQAAATALYHALLASPVRVPVTIAVDRGLLVVAGEDPRGGELLEAARWTSITPLHRYIPPR